MPRLCMEPDYNFDLAFILAAWTQERLDYGLDLVCDFSTVEKMCPLLNIRNSFIREK